MPGFEPEAEPSRARLCRARPSHDVGSTRALAWLRLAESQSRRLSPGFGHVILRQHERQQRLMYVFFLYFSCFFTNIFLVCDPFQSFHDHLNLDHDCLTGNGGWRSLLVVPWRRQQLMYVFFIYFSCYFFLNNNSVLLSFIFNNQANNVPSRPILAEPAPEHQGSVQPFVAPEPAPKVQVQGGSVQVRTRGAPGS